MKKSSYRKLEREYIEIERHRLTLERDRLEFKKKESSDNKKFWRMNSGTRLTILVTVGATLVTAIVSAGQIWTSKISKDKEIAVTAMLKTSESEKLDLQNQRAWNLRIAEFVMANWKTLFRGTPDEQRVLAKIIPTIFPEDVSVALLTRLESTSPSTSKAIWRQARTSIETAQATRAEETPETVQASHVETQAAAPLTRNESILTPLLTNALSSSRVEDFTNIGKYPLYQSGTSESFNAAGPAPTLDLSRLEGSKRSLNAIYKSTEEENDNFTRQLKLGDDGRITIGDYKPTRISGLSLDVKPIQGLTQDYQVVHFKQDLTEDGVNQVIRALSSSSVPLIIGGVESTSSGVSPTLNGSTMISGRVIDADSGLPIASAVVQSDSPSLLIGVTTSTDATGYFWVTISSWQRSAGPVKLRVNREGYEPTIKEITDSTQFLSSLGIPLRKSASH